MRTTLFAAAGLGLAAGAALLGGGAQDGYVTLDASAQPLIERFNADVDRTRILMLVAPT